MTTNRARAGELLGELAARQVTMRLTDAVDLVVAALDEAEAAGYTAGEAAGRHDVELEARATGADPTDTDR